LDWRFSGHLTQEAQSKLSPGDLHLYTLNALSAHLERFEQTHLELEDLGHLTQGAQSKLSPGDLHLYTLNALNIHTLNWKISATSRRGRRAGAYRSLAMQIRGRAKGGRPFLPFLLPFVNPCLPAG